MKTEGGSVALERVNELPRLISAKEVKQYLGCNNNTLYAILKQRNFPSFRIGAKYYVNADEFVQWMGKKSREEK